jgi:hypothetical protein
MYGFYVRIVLGLGFWGGRKIMTWRLSHIQETSFHEEDVKGEWSDDIVEQAAQKVSPENTGAGRHGRRPGDYRHILETIREFLPDPIREEL